MLKERYDRYDFPFYLSLGNPFPPTEDGYSMDFTIGGKMVIDHMHHMNVLVTRYKMLLEDIQYDPILSQMRFLPQWHVFVWGNAKGK
jgi:hypothetical protein